MWSFQPIYMKRINLVVFYRVKWVNCKKSGQKLCYYFNNIVSLVIYLVHSWENLILIILCFFFHCCYCITIHLTVKSFKFCRLLKKCWHRNPDVRPKFEEIITELENILESEQTKAGVGFCRTCVILWVAIISRRVFSIMRVWCMQHTYMCTV